MRRNTSLRAGLISVIFFLAMSVHAQNIAFNSLPALQIATPIPGSSHVPGDMDGNGVSDILWFNPTTSQFGYWLMSTNDATGAVNRVGSKIYNVTPGYFVGAVGDFNGDGLADLVFTSNNHDLYLWTNNGNGGFTSALLGSYPAGWILIGAGDIDGDGEDDLLWLNPSQCEFGYWLMKNGVHTTSKIMNVACGYYPLSIGYYTPSNRLSIVWTSAAQDLYAWDSEQGGFSSYSFGTYGTGSSMIAFGGGYAGQNLSFVFLSPHSVVWGDDLTRTFSGVAQKSFGEDGFWSNTTYTLPWSSAGFLIEGNGTNKTGVIYQHGNSLEVCPPAGGSNYESTPAPQENTCPAFSFPAGWYVLGAAANGIVPGG